MRKRRARCFRAVQGCGQRGERWTSWVGRGAVWIALGAALTACNPMKFFSCRGQMKDSQTALNAMDDQEIPDVERALRAVTSAVEACEGVAPQEEFSKMKDAVQKLEKQLTGLRARENSAPIERPQLSEEELSDLVRQGDPGCPRGQKYEHPQNKQMITCTGPQLVEMSWADALDHFVERRGFTAHPQGSRLRLERGVQVFDFHYSSPRASSPPQCLEVVGLPGIAWQELVARATGVQPRRLRLKRPVPTKQGPLPLLVEGDEQQFTVKLGQCEPTEGQKPYVEPGN